MDIIIMPVVEVDIITVVVVVVVKMLHQVLPEV
jgi:hypothetical protein